jgi:hypothetical protein
MKLMSTLGLSNFKPLRRRLYLSYLPATRIVLLERPASALGTNLHTHTNYGNTVVLYIKTKLRVRSPQANYTDRATATRRVS